jgi:hypothetical protein
MSTNRECPECGYRWLFKITASAGLQPRMVLVCPSCRHGYETSPADDPPRLKAVNP